MLGGFGVEDRDLQGEWYFGRVVDEGLDVGCGMWDGGWGM